MLVRTKHRRKTEKERQLEILQNPYAAARHMCIHSFYFFFRYFWDEISGEELKANWHIEYLCNELQEAAERVGQKLPKEEDIIINIPPGTSKTSIVTIMFPAWCWTRWFWMRFITASYSSTLSLESAEYSRDLIRSEKFKRIFPELEIKEDKDTKGNFRIVKKVQFKKGYLHRNIKGGNRFSTSVKGTATGFHAHIIIVDDPLNPKQAVSSQMLESANNFCSKTLSTRKVDKKVTLTIYVMQRLHQNDPTGDKLRKKARVKHICLPAELGKYEKFVKPVHLKEKYVDGLLDAERMPRSVLEETEADMGQYEYAGQMGQNPTPPGGGMFQVDKLQIIPTMPTANEIEKVVRYWDKAGTADGGAFTAGVKMALLKDGRFLIVDVERGQWGSGDREKRILNTAKNDRIQKERFNNKETIIGIEQEGGSGGKESAENTIRRLAGFVVRADHPTGDKVYRADPFSVQVNWSNVLLLKGAWNDDYIEELRYFPFSTYKDQVDGSSGAFNMLTGKREAKSW